MGYHQAGFDVVGVDTSAARLAKYPFESHQDDAVAYLLAHGHEYDAIHASPPCTGYSQGTVAIPDRMKRYDRLIGATREALLHLGVPYIIENVEGAKKELVNPIMLCGRMFNLRATDTDGTPLVVDRHRLFEASPGIILTPPKKHRKHDRTLQVAGYGGARRDKFEARNIRKGGYVPKDLTVLHAMLGTPWMSEEGCFLCIPPVYTKHLGTQLLEQIP